MPPPVFPANGSLLATPSFPPSGPGEPGSPPSAVQYEGATTSHPRIYSHLFVSLPQPTRFLLVRARLGAPGRRRSLPGLGLFLVPAALAPASARVDAIGISQVFRRSFPCLCCVPGPRSSQRALAIAVTSVQPPLGGRRRPRTMVDFGANPQLQHSLPYASRGRCRPRARLASGRLARLYRMGVEPTGSLQEVSARVHDHSPLLLS